MEAKGIVNIGLEHIHPHPDNPRQQLGDLSELAESIKKKGIMQNLTVIPKEGEPGVHYDHRPSKMCGGKAGRIDRGTVQGCRGHDRQGSDGNNVGRKYSAK